MKTLQKFGAFSALYMAVAYLIGMAIFLAVLYDPSIEKQMVIFSTNLLMYVFFGIFLIVLALALHDQLRQAAPALMQSPALHL